MCRCSGRACFWRQVSLSPPPATNRTCNPNNTGSPTARLPQRPWEAASTGAIAEAGLILKEEEGMGRQGHFCFLLTPTEVAAQGAHLNSQTSAAGSPSSEGTLTGSFVIAHYGRVLWRGTFLSFWRTIKCGNDCSLFGVDMTVWLWPTETAPFLQTFFSENPKLHFIYHSVNLS